MAKRLGPQKLTEHQKRFCEIYISNNFDKKAAYLEAFELEEGDNKDDGEVSHFYLKQRVYKIMNKVHVQKYINDLSIETRHKYGVNKEFIIRNVLTIINNFDNLLALADLEDPTDSEIERFNRLSVLIKGADLRGAQDMLAKLIGAYEPEEIIHTVAYEVDFGDTKENNTINIDHDELN